MGLFSFTPYIKYKIRNVFGLGVMLLLLCLGFLISELRALQVVDHNLPSRAVTVMRIDSEPKHRQHTVQFEATLLKVVDSLQINTFEKQYPRLAVSVGRDNYIDSTKRGDYIISATMLYNVENNNNPFEFDYKEYLRRRGICYRAYVLDYSIGNSELIVTNKSLKDRAAILQRKIVGVINTLFEDAEQAALVSSLLIGYRYELSADIRDTFSEVGLSHILAVSGMHIGFVYMIMIVIFFPLLVNRFRRLGYLMIVLSLWVYAFVTGLSPSVVRATIMISILIGGKLFYLPYNSRNALFWTAIIMLCYSPMYIYDVGFQLSFMAVWSIIIFYSKVKSIIDKFLGKVPLINRLSPVISLSIAAQILSLPLSVYYFNIIPVWFLIANVMVVPVLPFIIGFSALAVLLGFFGIELNFLISFISFLLDFIIWVGDKVASFPNIKSIYVSNTVLLVGYLIIFAWVIYMNKPRVKVLTNVLLLSSLGLLVIAVFRSERPVDEIVIFNHYKNNSIHLFSNGQHNVIGSEVSDSVNLDYSNIGYFKHYGYEYNSIGADSGLIALREPFVSIVNHRFCVLLDDAITKRHRSNSTMKVDYLLVGDSVRISLYDLNKLITFDTVVILPSLKAYQRVNYIKQLDSLKIPCFDIKKEGAFRLPLN